LKILDEFINNCCEDETEKEVVRFGIDRIKVLIIGLLITCLVGIILGEFLRTVLFLICILPLRQNAGGFHLKSRWTCLVCSSGVLISSALILKYVKINETGALFVIILDALVLFAVAPVGNCNRILDEIEKKVYRQRTRFICGVETLVFLLLFMNGKSEWYEIFWLSETITGTLVVVGKVQEARCGREQIKCTE
jgi:accessory gene regulator B